MMKYPPTPVPATDGERSELKTRQGAANAPGSQNAPASPIRDVHARKRRLTVQIAFRGKSAAIHLANRRRTKLPAGETAHQPLPSQQFLRSHDDPLVFLRGQQHRPLSNHRRRPRRQQFNPLPHRQRGRMIPRPIQSWRSHHQSMRLTGATMIQPAMMGHNNFRMAEGEGRMRGDHRGRPTTSMTTTHQRLRRRERRPTRTWE